MKVLGLWRNSAFSVSLIAVTKNFLKPMLTLLIALPIALVVIGPIGYYAGEMLSSAMVFVYDKAGCLAIAVMSALIVVAITVSV